jgi:hypothetical protein
VKNRDRFYQQYSNYVPDEFIDQESFESAISGPQKNTRRETLNQKCQDCHKLPSKCICNRD